MKDELIINGKKYIHTPEVKEERLSGWITREDFNIYKYDYLNQDKRKNDDTRMIEIREGEIVVSEDDFLKAWNKSPTYLELIKNLGFKKDGV